MVGCKHGCKPHSRNVPSALDAWNLYLHKCRSWTEIRMLNLNSKPTVQYRFFFQLSSFQAKPKIRSSPISPPYTLALISSIVRNNIPFNDEVLGVDICSLPKKWDTTSYNKFELPCNVMHRDDMGYQ